MGGFVLAAVGIVGLLAAAVYLAPPDLAHLGLEWLEVLWETL